MRCRPAICKRFSSKVDTPLSGGLGLTAARPSPAEVLPATRGLCPSPPALKEGHLCLRQTQEKQAAGLPPASGPRSLDLAVSPLSPLQSSRAVWGTAVHPRAGRHPRQGGSSRRCSSCPQMFPGHGEVPHPPKSEWEEICLPWATVHKEN